jgi:hypothetical protein
MGINVVNVRSVGQLVPEEDLRLHFRHVPLLSEPMCPILRIVLVPFQYWIDELIVS